VNHLLPPANPGTTAPQRKILLPLVRSAPCAAPASNCPKKSWSILPNPKSANPYRLRSQHAPPLAACSRPAATGLHLKTAARAWWRHRHRANRGKRHCQSKIDFYGQPQFLHRLRHHGLADANPVRACPSWTLARHPTITFPAKAAPRAPTRFPAPSPPPSSRYCPTGTWWWPGEKQIGVNQNVDVLRFSGTIDPRLVQPGSIISSTQVANVRIGVARPRPAG
jgi:hypothetical protein